MPVDLSQAIENEKGEIGMKRNMPRPFFVPGSKTASGNAYVFSIKANISFSWVRPEDVESILGILGGCCGGKQKIFLLANSDDARRWENGGGR